MKNPRIFHSYASIFMGLNNITIVIAWTYEYKDMLLVMLVLIIIYLVFVKKTSENFDTTTDAIKAAVNEQYKVDIDAMRNLVSVARNMCKALFKKEIFPF